LNSRLQPPPGARRRRQPARFDNVFKLAFVFASKNLHRSRSAPCPLHGPSSNQSDKRRWADNVSHPVRSVDVVVGPAAPRPFLAFNLNRLAPRFSNDSFRYRFRVFLVQYLGVGDIPPSFSNGLPPSRCTGKLLLECFFVFPCRQLWRKVGPLDQYLWYWRVVL